MIILEPIICWELEGRPTGWNYSVSIHSARYIINTHTHTHIPKVTATIGGGIATTAMNGPYDSVAS